LWCEASQIPIRFFFVKFNVALPQPISASGLPTDEIAFHVEKDTIDAVKKWIPVGR
jgi:hypothetical protein